MDLSKIAQWPEPLTIPTEVRELKKKMLALLRSDDDVEKEQELNYLVAVSSGKAVTEEIPKQIGRRAGWASQQGTNFIELAIENPAQLIMDQDMLVTLAGSLGLHYNIHSSTSMAYGMAYRQGQGRGYDPVHEYTDKLLNEIGRFREALRQQGLDPADDGLPRLYSINPHMAVSAMPAEEDRLAQDVSVDPFGDEIRVSRIFENKEARLGIWKYYLWEYQNIGDDVNEFAQILGNIEEVGDAQDYIRENMIELLAEENYISNELLDFINAIRRDDELQQLGRILDIQSLQFQDLPDSIDELKNHINGTSLAQRVATLDPREAYDRLPSSAPEEQRRPSQELVDQLLSDAGLSLPKTKKLDLATDTWRSLNEDAQKAILDREGAAFQDVTDFFKRSDSEFQEEERKPSEVMKNIASTRAYQDDFNKESTIFRRLLPLWMPFANDYPAVKQLWEGITGQSFKGHEHAIGWLYDPDRNGKKAAMNDPRDEEDVIAAAAGAYVWGHFTQIPPGYNRTFVDILEEIDMFMTFESHFVGPAEQTRIWKPKDQIEVVKAINNTEVPIRRQSDTGEWKTVNNRATDQCRITIDMEHLASQKVDPMWVINPGEDGKKRGYKGLDDGDGKYILMQHVTHPYITESGAGHEHGPIQRGDTLVYKYIHSLIERGMAQDDEHPAVFMYEMGGEKTETMFLLRLIMRMIEHGIEPKELTSKGGVTKILNKDEPDNLKEYLIQKYFGVTDTEVQHEWQEIFEHALDPLEDLLQSTKGTHTWMGRAALGQDNRPEEWQKEQWK